MGIMELPERKAMPGEPLPELPDEVYGDDSIVLEELDPDDFPNYREWVSDYFEF